MVVDQSDYSISTILYIIIINISHLSILLYYISWGITRIFSLPGGYKGKYDPYFPPSGNRSDQSESLFYFIPVYLTYFYYMNVKELGGGG